MIEIPQTLSRDRINFRFPILFRLLAIAPFPKSAASMQLGELFGKGAIATIMSGKVRQT